ncbi:MAG: hypothetical protein SVW77_00215, partial [Candidatus Nanohaloarchaea archaeon]|nr:hypothetical protein [Candidatus Nanohaloarchaea archaeon]
DVDEDELQELRSKTRAFVSRIGEDLRAAQDEDIDEDVPVDVDGEESPGDIDVEDYEKAKESAERSQE